jgi:hypothetical protein
MKKETRPRFQSPPDPNVAWLWAEAYVRALEDGASLWWAERAANKLIDEWGWKREHPER